MYGYMYVAIDIDDNHTLTHAYALIHILIHALIHVLIHTHKQMQIHTYEYRGYWMEFGKVRESA